MEKLATGFAFTEGPAADAAGNVYFTDIPNNQILIWKTEEKLDTFQLKSNGANGLYFDQNENLLVCEGGKGRIAAYQKDEEYKVIASNIMIKDSTNLMTYGRIEKEVFISLIQNMREILNYHKMANTYITSNRILV